MNEKKTINQLRARTAELEAEVQVLRDRVQQRVLDQHYPPQRPSFRESFLAGARMQDTNRNPAELQRQWIAERFLPARKPQPKSGWFVSLWRGFTGLFG